MPPCPLTVGHAQQGDLVWVRHPAHVWTAATVSGPQPADGSVVVFTLDDKEVRPGGCAQPRLAPHAQPSLRTSPRGSERAAAHGGQG